MKFISLISIELIYTTLTYNSTRDYYDRSLLTNPYIYKYSSIDKSSLSTAPARKHTTSSSSTVPRSQATSSTDVSVIFASELIQILSKHCAVIQQQKIGTYSMMMDD